MTALVEPPPEVQAASRECQDVVKLLFDTQRRYPHAECKGYASWHLIVQKACEVYAARENGELRQQIKDLIARGAVHAYVGWSREEYLEREEAHKAEVQALNAKIDAMKVDRFYSHPGNGPRTS